MKQFDAALDRLLLAIAGRSSGRAITIIALALYGGIGLALPLIFGMSTPWLVSFNMIGTGLAAAFVLAWFGLRVQESHRRHLVEWTSDLRLLNAEEFEWLVGEIFRREGWKVEETGQHSGPDGNVDLRMSRDKQRAIVQCKRWAAWQVGVDEIRAFGGTLMREGLPGSAGYYVTLSGFTDQAIAEAKQLGVTLIGNRGLYARAEKLRKREVCPVCGSSMILDRSARGWWFRCVAAGCNGKRDLGSDPARAVELLTETPGGEVRSAT